MVFGFLLYIKKSNTNKIIYNKIKKKINKKINKIN